MKSYKIMKLTLIFAMGLIVFLSGCSVTNSSNKISIKEDDDTINIYTTLYLFSDFAKKIGGDNINVINLVPPGVSPHDYEPTAKDMVALINGDMFVYNGIGLESWIEKIIVNIDQADVLIIDASKNINTEGLREDNEEAHDESNEDEQGIDSHVWLDPMNALKQAEEIKNALINIDPANITVYEENFQDLKILLTDLDDKYREELQDSKRKEFFVSHAAFGYLAKRYELIQHSISGVIPADEPSPSELAEIIKKANELSINYILLDPNDVTKISTIVAEEISAKTALIHTIGSLNNDEIEDGLDYFKLMESNLVTLKMALNE